MTAATYPFLRTAARIINSGQARTLLLTGNIHDLFRLPGEDDVEYVPLVGLLSTVWNVTGKIVLVYELNGPIRLVRPGDKEKLAAAWMRWRTGWEPQATAGQARWSWAKLPPEAGAAGRSFETHLQSAVGNPTVALELLRQLCLCSRSLLGEAPILEEDLLILIEAADMLIPHGEISRLSDADRHRIGICRDWFSDPGFLNNQDAVVLMTESRSMLNERVHQLPHVLEVRTHAPDAGERRQCIAWFRQQRPKDRPLRLRISLGDLSRLTAGLSIHALLQLLKGACHEGRALTHADVVGKVEQYIQAQLGDEVVEFKKPAHTLKDVMGFGDLKRFLKEELAPRLRSAGPDSIAGAAVCGPIGVGKTFLFEALAGELDMVVLVLKNIRSQWFGQTDVLFERLRRVLDALAKVLIFVDEADTQFGGIGPDVHPTERRLTGKVLAMMSDPALRGRIVWLLMTARIHLLSPDLRRPGRVGDLIIPVLDPEGPDREQFILWAVQPVCNGAPTARLLADLAPMTEHYSAAAYASLRSELLAEARIHDGRLTEDRTKEIVWDHLDPAIGETRRYQTLQALVHCTRRSLLPRPDVTEADRKSWEAEIRALEARGIR